MRRGKGGVRGKGGGGGIKGEVKGWRWRWRPKWTLEGGGSGSADGGGWGRRVGSRMREADGEVDEGKCVRTEGGPSAAAYDIPYLLCRLSLLSLVPLLLMFYISLVSLVRNNKDID